MTTTTITVKRPNGQIETVDVSAKFPVGLTDQMFATIQESTRAAGRGEALSYNVTHESDAADSAWAAVERLQDQAEDIEESNYALACKIRSEADKLAAQWAMDYPEAAAARAADNAAHRQELRETPEYQAMINGRD